jgi:hypothetical protein
VPVDADPDHVALSAADQDPVEREDVSLVGRVEGVIQFD